MNDQLARILRDKLVAAWSHYEQAKASFAAVNEAYARKHPDDPGTAETKAASDWRRKKAADDCAWHGAEMQRYGAALSALLLDDLLDVITTPETDFDTAVAEAQRLTVEAQR